ncbi:hypothetical protein HanIR_Chr06g0264481 [Helianthus annuus]|nr:hypothetical protein HanIR_Chr06g0264481 [Helianthus annuus]
MHFYVIYIYRIDFKDFMQKQKKWTRNKKRVQPLEKTQSISGNWVFFIPENKVF